MSSNLQSKDGYKDICRSLVSLLSLLVNFPAVGWIKLFTFYFFYGDCGGRQKAGCRKELECRCRAVKVHLIHHDSVMIGWNCRCRHEYPAPREPCALFPQGSHIHGFGLKRRVTPALSRGRNAKLCNLYHDKNLPHQSHNACPADTRSPIEKRIINRKLLLISKAIGHLAPISLTKLRHINAPTRSLGTSMRLILPPAHLVTVGSRASSGSAPPLLEFSASWHPTLHFHYHFQISLENPSIQASPLLLKSVAPPGLEWPCSFSLCGGTEP